MKHLISFAWENKWWWIIPPIVIVVLSVIFRVWEFKR